jgi:hypothetical protein
MYFYSNINKYSHTYKNNTEHIRNKFKLIFFLTFCAWEFIIEFTFMYS